MESSDFVTGLELKHIFSYLSHFAGYIISRIPRFLGKERVLPILWVESCADDFDEDLSRPRLRNRTVDNFDRKIG